MLHWVENGDGVFGKHSMRKMESQELRLEVVHPDAAGIDIGNEFHYLAVPPS
jgi:hypothetical protein